MQTEMQKSNTILPDSDTFQKYQVVVHCDSRLTLTARKIFNVLNSFQASTYGSEEVQKISENEVINRLGKSKKHIDYYRKQFLSLGKTNFDFFGFDENNKKFYGTCPILSGAFVDEGSEEWIYSTPSKIMEWIQKRSEQITLSFSIQDALNSKYSLALYEEFLCKLEGGNKIISFTPDEIRFITCGPDKHKEYKYLKKQVIKPSLDELSEHSNLIVEIESEERKQRKVSSINFLVTVKNGSEEETNIISKMNQEFGIDIAMARKLAKEYEIEQIENALVYTQQKYNEGAIVALKGRTAPNVGGFAVNAIRKSMMKSAVNISNHNQNKYKKEKNTGNKKESFNEKETEKAVKQYLIDHPEQDSNLKMLFIKSTDKVIQGLIQTEGFNNPIVKYQYLKFAETNCSDLRIRAGQGS